MATQTVWVVDTSLAGLPRVEQYVADRVAEESVTVRLRSGKKVIRKSKYGPPFFFTDRGKLTRFLRRHSEQERDYAESRQREAEDVLVHGFPCWVMPCADPAVKTDQERIPLC